mmetsp:Transcript_14969/g.36806  ORF Transcript_14969/g.36806 Transcript_14969/m.36806 type:complete len:218 (+) Transcript_14969:602-1255(+)
MSMVAALVKAGAGTEAGALTPGAPRGRRTLRVYPSLPSQCSSPQITPSRASSPAATGEAPPSATRPFFSTLALPSATGIIPGLTAPAALAIHAVVAEMAATTARFDQSFYRTAAAVTSSHWTADASPSLPSQSAASSANDWGVSAADAGDALGGEEWGMVGEDGFGGGGVDMGGGAVDAEMDDLANALDSLATASSVAAAAQAVGIESKPQTQNPKP